ncbi:MAG TPA: 6-carboxytetrahydropterin synthase QueD [Planctomycetes bacterium]|nr:6-carboxytetrahydropterin synthase QueD [Planctomycetota bacterium]
MKAEKVWERGESGPPVLLVTKEFVFDAAHQLPDYDGKCERLHGHTWKLQVTVKSEVNPRSGIAFDFVKLKKIVMERVIDVLDHSFVNDFLEHPSAENICLFVWEKCRDLPLYEVKVWETPTSFATFRPGL